MGHFSAIIMLMRTAVPALLCPTMGTSYRFECNTCRSSEIVCGGTDVGFFHGVTTLYCVTCRTLQDAITSDGETSPDDWKELPARCRRSKKHPFLLWRKGDPCPRCSGPMTITQEMLWD